MGGAEVGTGVGAGVGNGVGNGVGAGVGNGVGNGVGWGVGTGVAGVGVGVGGAGVLTTHDPTVGSFIFNQVLENTSPFTTAADVRENTLGIQCVQLSSQLSNMLGHPAEPLPQLAPKHHPP